MKTILIPYNFSAGARRALGYALELFKGQKAKFILLHVSDLTLWPTELELAALSNRMYAEPRKKLRLALESIIHRQNGNGPVFEIMAEHGDWVDVISNYANRHSVDYVIMGKSRTGWLDKLIGNNVSGLIRRTLCPVIAVPEKSSNLKPRKIALLLSSSSEIEEEYLLPLYQLAKIWNTELVVWRLINREEEIAEVLQSKKLEHVFGDALGAFTFMDNVDALQKISRNIANDPIDLLAIPDCKSPLFDRLFQQNLARELVMNTEVPLLTLPFRKATDRWISLPIYPYLNQQR